MKKKTIAEAVSKGLAKRRRKEKRLKFYGVAAIVTGIAILILLFTSIISKGVGAFKQTEISVSIFFDPEVLDPSGARKKEDLQNANYIALVKKGMQKAFPEVKNRREKRNLAKLVSGNAEYTLRDMVVADPGLIGKTKQLWFIADDDVDVYVKHFQGEKNTEGSRLSDKQKAWVDNLSKQNKIQSVFNTTFFTAGDSREPEQAGIRGALMGSFYTILVTLLLSFPIGVAAAVYLEEFAPKNRWTEIIEVNINNLAAVPSIVFGLLGLAVFINFFGLPRSIPLVGAFVLTLMTLPTIIIAARAALKAVPPSIREAALGLGASKMQTVFHHVVPLALPGMLTGAIIGMAQALGETAPLLMIGMVAFIVDVPGGPMDPAAVLPVQIYLWADSPERAFLEKTSAAIMVLLGFLVVMNLLAVWLRKRFEKRW